MITRSLVPVPLGIASLALALACADSPTAPGVDRLIQPMGVVSGGPDENDFRNFQGRLWACPDAAIPASNFGYRWNIVDNATGKVVASGAKSLVAVGQCVLLASVATNVSGRFTAMVHEEWVARRGSTCSSRSRRPMGRTSPTGQNFPHPAPAATVNPSQRKVWARLSNDYGVVAVFKH